MLLLMSGEGIGDAVTESEGEEDVKQSAAEPTLQQQLQRAVATGRKVVCLAHRGRWEDLNFQRQFVSGKGPLTTRSSSKVSSPRASNLKVFSTVGNIVTKVRSRLNDDIVDALCFLKCHYR